MASGSRVPRYQDAFGRAEARSGGGFVVKRSQAAVLKLGAKQEAVLRQNKITWTGFLRDTAVFSLLPGEDSDLLRSSR